jgi:hypothetical protein
MISEDAYLTTLGEILLVMADTDYGTLINVVEKMRDTSEGSDILHSLVDRNLRGIGEEIADICRFLEEGDDYEDEDSTDVLSCIETT